MTSKNNVDDSLLRNLFFDVEIKLSFFMNFQIDIKTQQEKQV